MWIYCCITITIDWICRECFDDGVQGLYLFIAKYKLVLSII